MSHECAYFQDRDLLLSTLHHNVIVSLIISRKFGLFPSGMNCLVKATDNDLS